MALETATLLQGAVMDFVGTLTLRMQPSPRLLAQLASSGVLERLLLGSALCGVEDSSCGTFWVGGTMHFAGCTLWLACVAGITCPSWEAD